MAILRLGNEFSRENAILALDPARTCISKCTYCHVALSQQVQYANKKFDPADSSTFESLISRAFSPSYDPSNIIEYSLFNKYPVCYSANVEPFQDIPQAIGILKTLDHFGIPVVFQTKGFNFHHVWDYIKPFHDNSSIYLSFPTPNQDIIKRFEPNTPTASDRASIIKKAADHGFQVTLGLAPYCDEWIDDPAAFIIEMVDLGITAVYFDCLHLNRRQRAIARDKAMVKLAINVEHTEWSKSLLSHYEIIYDTCLDLDITLYGAGPIPVLYGYNNTIPTNGEVNGITRGKLFNYNDGEVILFLESQFLGQDWYDPSDRDLDDSLIVTFSDVMKILESRGRIDQHFSFSSMRDLIAIKTLPATYQQILKPSAPLREYFRLLWNDPCPSRFCWRHPWVRVCYKLDGTPHTDHEGNVIMIFDPDYEEGRAAEPRIEDDLSRFRHLVPDNSA